MQDAYHPTETGALAHVVLPAAQWAEKDGTQTNSERRVSLMRRARRRPGRRAPRLGDLRARRPRTRPRRPVQLADGGRRARRVRAHDRGAALRPDRPVARAAATRGTAAVARACTRAERRRAPGHRAPLHRPAVPDPERARADGADAARRAGGRARPRLPARPHHRPRRAPVAHDDPHRQGEGPARGRARAVRRAAPLRRAPLRRRRWRARARAFAARARDAARPAHGRRGRGCRVRAVPLGSAAPGARGGRVERGRGSRDPTPRAGRWSSRPPRSASSRCAPDG